MNALYIIIVLSIIGLLDSLYLTYKYLYKAPTKCVVFPADWCEIVEKSRQSKTLGIPNSLMGIMYYLSVLFLSILSLGGQAPFWALGIIIIIGFCFSVYFTYVQSVILKAFCIWCVISALDSILMLLTVSYICYKTCLI